MSVKRLVVLGLAAASLFLGGCSNSRAETSSTLQREACPAVVESQLIITHSCYVMTVPLDRGAGSRGVGKIFVLKLVPNGPVTSQDPMLVLGGDLGDQPEYGGLAPLPDRVHRVEYEMDPRGTGESTPRLSCPRQTTVTTFSANEPALLTSVARRCLASYAGRGLDVRDFSPKAVSADAEQLRKSLGVQQWNVETPGTDAPLATDYAARYPDAIRSLILDSPLDVTGSDAADTVASWEQLVGTCRAQPACRHRFPDVSHLWTEAVARVEQRPLELSGSGQITPETVARLVRTVMTGPGPGAPAELPAILEDLSRGKVDSNARGYLSNDFAACLGYRPACFHVQSFADDFALGSYLTQACPLVTATQVTPGAKLGLDAFGVDDPYRAACASWPRVTGRTDVGDVPTLVLTGRLDPFAPQQITPHGEHWYQINAPNQTHNLLGYATCVITMRNAWVDRVTEPPNTAPCRTDLPALAFPS